MKHETLLLSPNEAIVQEAANEAAVKPSMLRLGDERTIDTFVARLRMRLQELLDAGKLAAGEYLPQIMIGHTRLSVRVCVQADLFGPASLSIDTAGLRELLDSLRAR